jgi:beta propeller repeat protein
MNQKRIYERGVKHRMFDIIWVTLVLFAFARCDFGQNGATPRVSEIEIAVNETMKLCPKVWDDTVIWSEVDQGYKGDVFYMSANVKGFHISSQVLFELTNDGAVHIHPVFWRGNIVWAEDDPSVIKLVMFDVKAQAQETIFSIGSFFSTDGVGGLFMQPGILMAAVGQMPSLAPYDFSDEYIVWVELAQEQHASSGDIVGKVLAYNFEDDETVILETNSEGVPRVSDSTAAWMGERDGRILILASYLEQSGTFVVTEDATLGDISGDILVWRDETEGIWAHDLSNEETWRIAAGLGGTSLPAIDGNIVVWSEKRNDNVDVFGYDISSRTEFRITDNSEWQQWPDVHGDLVVWMDGRNGNVDIYGARLKWD